MSDIEEMIEKAATVCEGAVQGNLESRILNIDNEDPSARLYHAINDMMDRTDAYVRESQTCMAFVSDNKFFRLIAEKGMLGSFKQASQTINKATNAVDDKMANFSGVVAEFNKSMGGAIEVVQSAVVQLQSSSDSLDSVATETNDRATTVAAAAEQASANVQTVATATTELSSSITEISGQVTRSAQISSEAVDEAKVTNEKIQGLAEAAANIGEVVKLINDIASQTNLLALNATIEAARAGDAGKGFAVVASEVKNLANQTAKATDEIGAQISSIQAATNESVKAIENIGQTIENIDEIGSTIAAAIEEQGAATQEISRNVEEASVGTQEVTTNIVQVSESVSQSRTAAGEVNESSDILTQNAQRLNEEMEAFAVEVKKVV